MRNGEGDARKGHERAGHHAVGGIEGIVFCHRDVGLDGCVVHDHRTDKRDASGQHRAHLKEDWRVVGELCLLGVRLGPAPKCSLFGTGETNLLDAGNERIADAALFGVEQHLPLAHTRLDEHGRYRDDDGEERHYQRGGKELGRVVEDLPHVGKGEERGESRRKHHAYQLVGQGAHVSQPV